MRLQRRVTEKGLSAAQALFAIAEKSSFSAHQNGGFVNEKRLRILFILYNVGGHS